MASIDLFKRFRSSLAALRFSIWDGTSLPSACPTFTAGSGVPTAHEPKGSIYLRTGGSGASQVFYVATDSSGTWVALSNTALALQVQSASGQTYLLDASAAATGESIVKLKDNLASAFEIKEGTNSIFKVTSTNSAELITLGYPVAYAAAALQIADPGDAQAIPVVSSGVCNMTSAGSETRTVAIPSFIGQRLTLCHDTDGGAIAITFASAINQTGNTVATFTEVKDFLELVAVTIGGTRAWRVVANDGAVLS